MKIAVTQYQIEALSDWNAYASKISSLVKQAKSGGADLLLLPEYAGVEFGVHTSDDAALYTSLQPHMPRYLDLLQTLASENQIYIQAGTTLVATDNKFANRAYLFGKNGKHGYQDKLQLTAYEKQMGLIANGRKQTVFETEFGKVGIAICYDVEFPEIVRALVNAGAWLILVPSYTISLAGYHRVFISSRARAIENQCIVATAAVVGKIFVNEPVENGFGNAAVLAPADIHFPDDGILIAGKMNSVEMLFTDIDFTALEATRNDGAVQNYFDNTRLSLPGMCETTNLIL